MFRSLVILLVRNTQYALFYFLKFRNISHTFYVTKLFPSRQYWVINISFSRFPHKSVCVIPRQCFFYVLCLAWWVCFSIYTSISVLGPQDWWVITIANFLIASFGTLHPRALNASLWFWPVPCYKLPSKQTDCSNRLSLQNVVFLSHYHKIFLVIPSGVSILKVFFCSEDRGIMSIWSTGTYLPNCTSYHSIRPYLNIHCSEILNCHIFFSELNTADFIIQFNFSFAVSTVIYTHILLQ